MKAAISIGAYAALIGTNFLFILLCPPHLSQSFLFIYAAASLVFSLTATTFYTGLRSKAVDTAVATCAAGCLIATLWWPAASRVLFGAAAAIMIVSDFSTAQTGNGKLVTVARATAASTATLLLFDFILALAARTAVFLLAHVVAMWAKDYEPKVRPRSQNHAKLLYSASTCALYFGPLMLAPALYGPHAKAVYLFHSIIGNLILKYQDFSLKKYIASGNHLTIIPESVFLLGAAALTAALSLFVGMSAILLLVPIALLVFCSRLMSRIDWQ